MIEFLTYLEDCEPFVYYVFCYGILACGVSYVLCLLGKAFCSFMLWLEDIKEKQEEEKDDIFKI